MTQPLKCPHRFLGLEADEIVRRECLQQDRVTRQGFDQLARREWRVEEKADAIGDTELPELGGKGNEVIIMIQIRSSGRRIGCSMRAK